MLLTFVVWNNISASNLEEINSDGQTTIAVVKNVKETVSRRGRKCFYVCIEYSVNGKIYSPTIEIYSTLL